MIYLTKQYKFCAAHRYWNTKWSSKKNHQIFGEDVKVHGHNFILDIKFLSSFKLLDMSKPYGFICLIIVRTFFLSIPPPM